MLKIGTRPYFASTPPIIEYPRLDNIFRNLNEYKKFLGVTACDLTITADMEAELQDLLMLVQQLFMAILAVNDIHIVPNLRTGSLGSEKNLQSIPQGVIWIAGFLGCPNDFKYDMRFIDTVLYVRPSFLLLYGKQDSNAEEKLDLLGFPFQRHPDYHALSKIK